MRPAADPFECSYILLYINSRANPHACFSNSCAAGPEKKIPVGI